MKPNFKKTKTRNKTKYCGVLIGIILFVLGILIIVSRIPFDQKISATLLFFGFVIILMVNGIDKHKTINDVQLTLIIIISTLIVWVITIDIDFDIYVISIIISIIALKELLHNFLNTRLQHRMTILFCILLVLFAFIVVQRIINILDMYPS